MHFKHETSMTNFQYAALMCEMFGTKMQQYHLKPLFHDTLNKTKLEKLTL